MKRSGYLVALIFLSSINIFAQHTQKGLLELSLGPAFPVGSFAKKDAGNTSGHAKMGQTASVSYSYLFGKQFGLTGSFQAQRNPINARAMGSSFGEFQVFDGIYSSILPVLPNQPLHVTYSNWQVEKGSWFMGSLFTGGYGLFDLSRNKRISLTTKAMIGITYVRSPNVEARTVTDTSIVQLEQLSKSSVGFAYSLAAGMRYNCTRRISISIGLEFLGTPGLKFNDVKRTITTVQISSPRLPAYSMQQTSAHQKQTIQSLNTKMGIGLAL